MQIQEKYQELIIRYFDGNITDSDLEELVGWIKSDQDNFKYFLEMQELWNYSSMTTSTEDDTGKILSDFYKYVAEKDKSKRDQKKFANFFLRIAAVLVVAVVLNIVYQMMTGNRSLNSLKGISEISIPAGHKGRITLPDGTSIWLNSSTTLKYNSAFNGKKRKVYLDGEAFLEVAKDPDRLFEVETADLTLQVLGTSFNVKSYSSDDKVEATLIEGSLRILSPSSSKKSGEVILKPSQKAVYVRNGSLISITQLEAEINQDNSESGSTAQTTSSLPSEIELVSAWKDGDLIFHNEKFEDIALKMERWYGVKVTIADSSLKNERFTGKFVNNETIYQVLGVFDRSEAIQYITQGKEIIITKPN